MKKLLKKLSPFFALIMALIACYVLVGCGGANENTNSTEKEPCTTHDWVLVSTTATCVSDGINSYKCSVCGATGTKSAKKNRNSPLLRRYLRNVWHTQTTYYAQRRDMA